MIKKYMWDTGALSLIFMNHNKAKSILQDIIHSKAVGYVPVIVLSEFYYKTWQKFGQQAAELRCISITDHMKEIELKSEDKFNVGELKVKNTELSIVDAVILTLSDKLGTTLLTTDQPLSKIRGYACVKLNY